MNVHSRNLLNHVILQVNDFEESILLFYPLKKNLGIKIPFTIYFSNLKKKKKSFYS